MFKAYCSVKCIDNLEKRAVIKTPEFSSIEALSDYIDTVNKNKGAIVELCEEHRFYRSHEQEIYMMCHYDFDQFIVLADFNLNDVSIIDEMFNKWATEERDNPGHDPILGYDVDQQIDRAICELTYYNEFINIVHDIFTRHYLVNEA